MVLFIFERSFVILIQIVVVTPASSLTSFLSLQRTSPEDVWPNLKRLTIHNVKPSSFDFSSVPVRKGAELVFRFNPVDESEIGRVSERLGSNIHDHFTQKGLRSITFVNLPEDVIDRLSVIALDDTQLLFASSTEGEEGDKPKTPKKSVERNPAIIELESGKLISVSSLNQVNFICMVGVVEGLQADAIKGYDALVAGLDSDADVTFHLADGGISMAHSCNYQLNVFIYVNCFSVLQGCCCYVARSCLSW